MKNILISLMALMLLCLESPIHAYPYGLAKLRHGRHKVTVLYEFHEPMLNTTVGEMQSLSYKKAKKKCYASEQRFLTELESLNTFERYCCYLGI